MIQMVSKEKPVALVADDDMSLRLSIRTVLSKAGFEVLEAEDGTKALALFKSAKPDLVLLDVMMPGMDGFETCSAIRGLPAGKYTQILMVTGLDDKDSIERAFEIGANDFVVKPLNWTMLGQRVKYMLRAGRAFQELNMNQHRLAKTQELAKLGNWEVKFIDNTFHCSPEAAHLLGLSSNGQITYEEFLAPIVVKDQVSVKEKFDFAIKTKKHFSVNYRIILPNGMQRYILNRGEIFFNENGVAELMLGAIQDVTQLKQAEEEIRLLAFYDSLTGLANRMLFMDRLDNEITSAKRDKKCFALLYMDIDRFKQINDTFGHHIGDLLLKNVSEIFQKGLRSSDTASRTVNDDANFLIARLGGDEFIILLSNINKPKNAAIVARRLLHDISKSYDLDGQKISITASIGISIFPTDGESVEVLLKNADSAMYYAKGKGRNNYQFYKESLNRAVMERFSLEQSLKVAIKKDELLLYYQPQVELSTGKIVGAEALIRWLHPTQGMMQPDMFIPIAEETNLIIDINKWVIQTACKQNRAWQKAGLNPIRIAVNLSGYQIASQNIIKVIQEAIEEAGLDAKNLEVEITENIFMQDTEDTIQILELMKDLSLRIALDDFGTGYSSLSYLTTFPVDVIKIDRSFVMGCAMLKNNIAIIKAIIAMGHSLGMKIVAEGIETRKEFELIKKYGSDEGQGFYFSPPVPHDQFSKLLAMGTFPIE